MDMSEFKDGIVHFKSSVNEGLKVPAVLVEGDNSDLDSFAFLALWHSITAVSLALYFIE